MAGYLLGFSSRSHHQIDTPVRELLTQLFGEIVDNNPEGPTTLFLEELEMTPPRRHIAGQIAMVTRRCQERRYFLRPDNYICCVAVPLSVVRCIQSDSIARAFRSEVV